MSRSTSDSCNRARPRSDRRGLQVTRRGAQHRRVHWGDEKFEDAVDADELRGPAAGSAQDQAALARFQAESALDRTMLSWVRTTLSMVGFGFGMVAFFRSLQEARPGAEAKRLHVAAIAFGVALLVLGLVSMVFAGAIHRRSLRALRRGELPRVSQWSLSLVLVVVLLVPGVVGIAVLLRS